MKKHPDAAFTTTIMLSVVVGVLLLASVSVWSTAPAQWTAEQRVERAFRAIEMRDQTYAAVVALDPQAVARARSLDRQRKARGPLFSEPILIKDNIEMATLPTTAGSLALAENHTGRNAPLVRQLENAGAVVIGKANLSEWANFRSEFSSSGWSGIRGQSRNAVDPKRSPCGSSSGSAVAVALGYVDIAIGTETSGSIVCPAAVNGVVGFKPTHGLVSGEGIVPLALTQDTAGPIAINVRLAARTLAVIANPEVEDAAAISRQLLTLDAVKSLKGLRIGVYASTLGYDPRRDDQLYAALKLLRAGGAEIINGMRIEPYEAYRDESYDVLLWEFRRDLNAYLASLPNDLNHLTLEGLIEFNTNSAKELEIFDQSIFLKAQAISDTEAEYRKKRMRTQSAMREEGLDRLFEENDLDVLIGITEGPAWMIDPINGDAFFGPSMAGPAAVAGNPHITLPLAEVAGMPVGISLIGERWQDHRLAAIARLLETAAYRAR